MIDNLTRHVRFLVDNDITAEQHLLLHCLHLDRLETMEKGRYFREAAGGQRPVANLYMYHSVRAWTQEEITDLIKKGFVKNTGQGKEYYPDNLIVTEKFTDAIYAGRKLFYEFLELYPHFARSFRDDDSRRIPLRMVPEEHVYDEYIKYVGSVAEHSRMMKVLEWAVEHDQINVKITNFLATRYWRQLETLMDEEDVDRTTRGQIV
jgi:hypothetical protein